MIRRTLGNTSLEVSILGFGASPLGNVFRATSFDENQRAVDCAVERGINFFDVSPYYGLTSAEERLGRALEGKRDQVVLATKCGRYGATEFDFSVRRIKQGVEDSLRRLKTDHIDLLQAHDIEFAHAGQIVQEALPAMRDLQIEGKARFIGITGYPVAMLKKVAAATSVDTILSYCRYTLMNTDMESVLTPFVKQHGIGLINASPLMMGILSGHAAPTWHPASPEMRRAGERAAQAATERHVTLAAVALQFALANPAVASTLVGMATQQEVEANLLATESTPDPDVLEAVTRAIGNGFNTSWPSGLSENNPEAIESGNTIV